MSVYEPVSLLLTKGDIITSDKSMIIKKSPLDDEFYLVKKAEYLGDGKWLAIEKEEAEVEEVEND